MLVGPADAYNNGTTTFSWQANHPEENVTGYRLYYGAASRFDSSGKPINNFSYDYYIDLAESVRCTNSSYGNDCESLTRDELLCDELNTNSPFCTLSYLQGTLHLALTAYSTTMESGFTREITIRPEDVSGQPPQQPQPPDSQTNFLLFYIPQLLSSMDKKNTDS
jgi:hypothetical protein